MEALVYGYHIYKIAINSTKFSHMIYSPKLYHLSFLWIWLNWGCWNWTSGMSMSKIDALPLGESPLKRWWRDSNSRAFYNLPVFKTGPFNHLGTPASITSLLHYIYFFNKKKKKTTFTWSSFPFLVYLCLDQYSILLIQAFSPLMWSCRWKSARVYLSSYLHLLILKLIFSPVSIISLNENMIRQARCMSFEYS